MDESSLLPMIGAVATGGSILGTWIGNRVNIQWLKERLTAHEKRLDDHSARLRAHDIALGAGGIEK